MEERLAWVVEDDENLSKIFTEAIRQAGYEVMTFLSGDLVLQVIDQLRPELIVLDLHLPHISGIELLHNIRATRHLAGVKIVLATADPLLADQFSGQADVVLIKPVSFGQLRDLAMRLVNK